MTNIRIVLGVIAVAGAGLLHLLGIDRLVPYAGRPTITVYPAGALLLLGLALIFHGLRRSIDVPGAKALQDSL